MDIDWPEASKKSLVSQFRVPVRSRALCFQMSCIPPKMRIMAKSEEELKSLLMRVKEESERADLKLNTKKSKITSSSPITA